MPLNLHELVRSAITTVKPDETVTIYKSTGQTNVKGRVTPSYTTETVAAQVQGASSADLQLIQNIAQNTYVLKFWIPVASESSAPSGIIRPLTKTGDIIKRANGTYWLITAIPDQFADTGWESVLATLQELPPAGVTS